MVNALSSTNVLYNTPKVVTNPEDIKKLSKYINNEALKETPDTFKSTTKSAFSSAALFEGIPIFNFIVRKTKIKNTEINEAFKNIGKTNKDALTNLLKGEDKLSKRILEFIKTSNNNKLSFTDLKSQTKLEYKAVKTAKKAKKAADASKAAGEVIKTAAEETAKTAAKETAEKAVGEAAKTGTKQLGKLGKIGKFMKSSGAGIMLAFSGIIEGLTEVVPTFKELGKEKGMKQLGKSAIKVIGDTAGFIAGEQIGVAAGTAIGTAICPGIGTAIGAVCGFVGGMLGSFIAGKVTKAITGKSEREIAKEQQEQENAKQIANDEMLIQELKKAAELKLQEEAQMNNGELSEDSLEVLEILDNMNKTNPFAA